MPSYLVTGAAGFIGSALVRALLKRGERVRGIDNFASGKRSVIAALPPGLEFREIDIRDDRALHEAVDGVDRILHMAALVSVPMSVAEPRETHRVNVEGTLNVLLAARDAGVKRLVFAASCAAYGDAPGLPKREDMAPAPTSPYAAQKLAAEFDVRAFHKAYGLETVALRFFNVYGPGQDPSSPYSGVIGLFIRAMLEGRTPTIFGDGEQSRDFVYVDDVVDAVLKASDAAAEGVAGECFNIGSGRAISLNAMVALLRDITGYARAIDHAPPRTGDVRHSEADISRAMHHLGYHPRIAFAEGLRRTVAWHRAGAG